MAIKFFCGCNQVMNAPDAWAGRRCRCKRCSAILVIPPPPGTPSPSQAGVSGNDFSFTQSQQASLPTRSRRRRRQLPGLLLATAASCLVLVGIAVAVLTGGGTPAVNSDQPTTQQPDGVPPPEDEGNVAPPRKNEPPRVTKGDREEPPKPRVLTVKEIDEYLDRLLRTQGPGVEPHKDFAALLAFGRHQVDNNRRRLLTQTLLKQGGQTFATVLEALGKPDLQREGALVGLDVPGRWLKYRYLELGIAGTKKNDDPVRAFQVDYDQLVKDHPVPPKPATPPPPAAGALRMAAALLADPDLGWKDPVAEVLAEVQRMKRLPENLVAEEWQRCRKPIGIAELHRRFGKPDKIEAVELIQLHDGRPDTLKFRGHRYGPVTALEDKEQVWGILLSGATPEFHQEVVKVMRERDRAKAEAPPAPKEQQLPVVDKPRERAPRNFGAPPPLPPLPANPGWETRDAEAVQEACAAYPTDPVSAVLALDQVLQRLKDPKSRSTPHERDWLQKAIVLARPRALALLKADYRDAVADLDLRGALLVSLVAERVQKDSFADEKASLVTLKTQIVAAKKAPHPIWKVTDVKMIAHTEPYAEGEGLNQITLTPRKGFKLLTVTARVENISTVSDPPYWSWGGSRLRRVAATLDKDIKKRDGPGRFASDDSVYLLLPGGEMVACGHVCQSCTTLLGVMNIRGEGGVHGSGTWVKKGDTFKLEVIFSVPNEIEEFRFFLLGSSPIGAKITRP